MNLFIWGGDYSMEIYKKLTPAIVVGMRQINIYTQANSTVGTFRQYGTNLA